MIKNNIMIYDCGDDNYKTFVNNIHRLINILNLNPNDFVECYSQVRFDNNRWNKPLFKLGEVNIFGLKTKRKLDNGWKPLSTKNFKKMVVDKVNIYGETLAQNSSQPLTIELPRVIRSLSVRDCKCLMDLKCDYINKLSIHNCSSLTIAEWPLGLQWISLFGYNNILFDYFPNELRDLHISISIDQLDFLYACIDKLNKCDKCDRLTIWLERGEEKVDAYKNIMIKPTFLKNDNIQNVTICMQSLKRNGVLEVISPPIENYRPLTSMTQMFEYMTYIKNQINELI